MDYCLQKKWYEAIEELRINSFAKEELKQEVYNLLKNGGVIILTPLHFSQLVGINSSEINKMIAFPEAYYREFDIPKRKGGVRTISAPYPSLMMVQKWIYEKILLPKYNFPPCVTGFVKGRSICDNANPHCGHNNVLKMDLKDFFPSISLNRVINVFKIMGYHHQMAYYLAKLCCKDGVLPQGAPTSPILSNIIAGRMDRRLNGLCNQFNITYTRYADDLTFSGDKIGESFVKIVNRIIEDEGFILNKSKTKILRKNSKKIITGVSISSGRATIPKQLKRRLRHESYFIHKYGLKDHMRHEGIRDHKYKMRINGYFAYWKSIENNDSLNLLYDKFRTRVSTFKRLKIRISNIIFLK